MKKEGDKLFDYHKTTAYDKPNYTGLINTLAYKNENFELNSTIPVFAALIQEISLLSFAKAQQ